MKLTKEIKESITGLSLRSGQTLSTTCPFCHKDAFSVTKDRGVILYHCFKASCGASGRIPVGLTAADVKAYVNSNPTVTGPVNFTEVDKFGKYASWVSVNRSKKAMEYLARNNCLEAYNAGYPIYWDVKTSRVVFPLYQGNKIVDAAGRALVLKYTNDYGSFNIPKWFRYNRTGLPMFINPHNFTDTVVLVEDAASACSVSRVAKGCALLGTHLTDRAKMAIISRVASPDSKVKHVVVCLDKDATAKAMKIAKQLSPYVKTTVVILPDDAKYLSTDVLRKELNL